MKKWEIQPDRWNNLTLRQQQKIYKSGVRLSIKVMFGITIASLLVETILGK
ncbi:MULTISPECIES: hypothetical protein [Pseudanabaena]|uniref:Uncharacterized protein n=2 Tax=Pseudanabaena TaxID=1152 RepID=L8N0Z2_9CYAN|nr:MULTISPECIES: hypothetical protein [Pseudanabaena]ELS33867.1 hypothetical protein Pse7429DRAFT_1091 [Pseudanabaena biceps PCC 7429]MDG3493894.1 hypothetical protein [Pseudanabaena catenata USMAC16]